MLGSGPMGSSAVRGYPAFAGGAASVGMPQQPAFAPFNPFAPPMGASDVSPMGAPAMPATPPMAAPAMPATPPMAAPAMPAPPPMAAPAGSQASLDAFRPGSERMQRPGFDPWRGFGPHRFGGRGPRGPMGMWGIRDALSQMLATGGLPDSVMAQLQGIVGMFPQGGYGGGRDDGMFRSPAMRIPDQSGNARTPEEEAMRQAQQQALVSGRGLGALV